MSTKKLAKELGLLRKRSHSSSGLKKIMVSNQIFSHLIVIDFESTCWREKNNYSQEIIEFPAVLLNTCTGEVESEFHTYVQPQEHPTLSEFCTELTGITQMQVEAGIPLQICMSRFSRWLQNLQMNMGLVFPNNPQMASAAAASRNLCTFLTWSDWDLGVCLQYECRRKQIHKPDVLNSWIDLRGTYRLFYDRKPKGLKGALQDLGIQFAGREHSGLDDARNTAQLAARMMRDGCVMKVTRSLTRAPSVVKHICGNTAGDDKEENPKPRKREEALNTDKLSFSRDLDLKTNCAHGLNSTCQTLVSPKTLLCGTSVMPGGSSVMVRFDLSQTALPSRLCLSYGRVGQEPGPINGTESRRLPVMLRRVRQSLRQLLILMARRPGLLCGTIVLGVLLVLAIKFTCSRAKNVVAPPRPPVRFFAHDAPVVDLYLGQIDQVERLRSMAEVSLIFFYAPWCAHSMAARQELQQVAKKLARQVQFVAVNCWWSQGKCRKQNHFFQYPSIHLFYRRFGPIEYRGPFVAPYMESFILRVITPLTYLPSTARLKEFLSNHEPRVVGFFQFNSSPQPPGYITYLLSALQALKRDFRGVALFGVVTNKQVAEVLSLRDDESVYLSRRLNSSLIFPRSERNFTSESICNWVFEHHEDVLRWLQPPGTKSRLLERELNKGPALLLFLEHNPLGSSSNPVLQQVGDIAVRYHSCENNSSNLDGSVTPSSSCCQSVLLAESARSVCEVCLSSSRPLPTSSSICPTLPFMAQGGDVVLSHLRHCCLQRESSPVLGCSDFRSSYSPFGQYSACCRRINPRHNESEAKEVPDVHRTARTPSTSTGDDITGLRCQTNRTLRFYVLDVALNWPLAVRLGATGRRNVSLSQQNSETEDSPFAAIVDLKDEVHYVLHRSPASNLTESLEAFIRNFSAPYRLLQRHLVGEEVRRGGAGDSRPPEEPQRAPPLSRPLITELTTSSFLPHVMDVKKDVLLFYYTQWCGFCSALNHIVIQLARLLQGNSTITVARVNVARNDLPWEFMVDHVPSILLFPKYRKHFSVKYPDDLLITLPNLLRFILQHSGSVQYADKPMAASVEAWASGPDALFRAEFLTLHREVQALRHARERLSQQLAQLWRDNRRLKFDTRSLEAQNAKLKQERESLEEQHREKSRQLVEAVRRLQELSDTSESLLNENALLRVLLAALKDRSEAKEQVEEERKEKEQQISHMAS
ncbi:Thioredoxin domain-containing protein 11 [Takifugu flavidus]|uniref:ERI1 exoribonuclease 2 n=2 Tax=Takifugu flavidus TaxID=433684 RepID=A0A5C6MUH7_9TELE|nr:Thioredoxin domain-containing protein 11 [Takifugu flavidus]